MTIHPLGSDDAVAARPLQARPDSGSVQERPNSGSVQKRPDTASAYDSTWAEQPATQEPATLDRVMGTDGKIYVVLAVVLLIWFGLLVLLWHTDCKIDRLERRLDETSSDHDDRPGDAP
jgi:hypothetical protein